MKPHHARAGVTLWEVVSAIAIIVIVAAILFPVFQQNPHPQPSRCRSNLKQLGLAFLQYTQDYDELYPQGVNHAGNGWAGQIYIFVKSTGVYKCPNDALEGKYISYAENQHLADQSLSKFTEPAATVELYEFTTLNCDPSTPETISATGVAAPQNSARHDAASYGLYFLAVDGHTKFLKPGDVSSGPNAVHPSALTLGGNIETTAWKPDMTFAIK